MAGSDLSPVLLEHTCSTRREGMRVLLLSTTTMAVFIFFAVWAKVSVPTVSEPGPILLYLLIAFIYFASLWYGCVNVLADRVFRCSLSRESICCSGAVQDAENFCVHLADIDCIQLQDLEDSCWWYLITKDGRRFCLPNNYGNPVAQFIELVMQARPSLRVERK